MVATEAARRTRRARRTGPTRRRPPRETWRDTIRGVHIASEEEGRRLFDFQARKALGISGDEFIVRWDAGEYRRVSNSDQAHKIDRLAMLIPVARRTPA